MWRTVGHLSHAASTVPAARLKCRGGDYLLCLLTLRRELYLIECYMYFSPCSPVRTRQLSAQAHLAHHREAACESTCSLQSRCRCWSTLPA